MILNRRDAHLPWRAVPGELAEFLIAFLCFAFRHDLPSKSRCAVKSSLDSNLSFLAV